VFCVCSEFSSNFGVDSMLKYSVLYKGDGLPLTICVCYSWDVVLKMSASALQLITCRTGLEYGGRQEFMRVVQKVSPHIFFSQNIFIQNG
jgi:hypothetical protein